MGITGKETTYGDGGIDIRWLRFAKAGGLLGLAVTAWLSARSC